MNGRFVDRLYTPHGVVEQPIDMSTRAFRVYSNGRWYPESGLVTGAFDGTIYIPDVPDGPYLLNVVYRGGAMSWYHHEDHEFVEVTVRTGRPEAQPATNVPMQLQLDDLAPWDLNSHLYVDCYENGTEHAAVELDTPMAVGATQVRGMFDWASTSSGPEGRYGTPYLLDGSAGDTLTISRVTTLAFANRTVSRLTQVAHGPASTQRDGEPSSYAGTFMDVIPTTTQEFTVDVPAIAAQRPDVDGWFVSLRRSPSSVAFDTFGPPLLEVSEDATATEPVTFSESYGDPFDAGWQLVASGGYVVRFEPRTLPDGRRVNFPWSAYATEQRHLRPGDEFALRPTRAFATSASLDGHPLAGDVPWDGRSPLSFHVDAPGGEGEEGFTADVLWFPPGQTHPELGATLRSPGSEVTLPPGDVFQLDVDYLVRIAVTNETETSRSAASTLLGPFRLVQQ